MRKALLQECDAIIAYIAAARDIVRSGHMSDITGLEARVASLCAQLMKADAATKQACLPKLTTILENLDSCEADMRVFNDAPRKGLT